MKNLDFIYADVIEYLFEPSDFITSYYVVQFIRPSQRQLLIDKIYQSLNWGGAFLYFEKVRASDARFQDIMTGIYHEYKLEQGYTAEEIVQKSRSLKGVLEPFSTQGNMDMLKRAGFVDTMSVAKFGSFEGILAIK
jgi:tRNA (cmo5U34)-methyltransferase